MKFAAFGRVAQLVRAPRLHRGGPGFESLRAHHQTERIFLIGRMAHFAGSESLRLRILEADRSFARCAEGLRCQMIQAPDGRDVAHAFRWRAFSAGSDVFPIVLKFSSQLSLSLRICEKMNRGVGRRKRLPHIDVQGFTVWVGQALSLANR